MNFKNVSYFLKEPYRIIQSLSHFGYLGWLPDSIYLKLLYRLRMGKKLNLKNPKLFTEKLQWLKLNNRKDIYTTYVDKFAVREHISQQLDKRYLIPLIATYDRPEEIEWDILPNKFVIKYNHGSGTNLICTDKSKFNKKEALKSLKKWGKENWYWFGREWPYKNMKKKVIIEQFLEDEESEDLKDYKLWVFNGKVKYINVHFVYDNKVMINVYDINWELQEFCLGKNSADNNLNINHEKPVNLELMIEYAEKLSENMPFVRIDFYEVNSRIYFGEITFYPTSGFIKFHPRQVEIDKFYGDLVDL